MDAASRLNEDSVECGRRDYAAAMNYSQQVEDEERRKIALLVDRCNQELDVLPDQVFTFICKVAVKDVPPELF